MTIIRSNKINNNLFKSPTTQSLFNFPRFWSQKCIFKVVLFESRSKQSQTWHLADMSLNFLLIHNSFLFLLTFLVTILLWPLKMPGYLCCKYSMVDFSIASLWCWINAPPSLIRLPSSGFPGCRSSFWAGWFREAGELRPALLQEAHRAGCHFSEFAIDQRGQVLTTWSIHWDVFPHYRFEKF